jgi:putative peptidoglycan lipid II flippase
VPRSSPTLLDWGLRLTLMLTLPAALGARAAGHATDRYAVPATAPLGHSRRRRDAQRALVAYSVGLTGLIAVKVLAPGFYARQDIRTPVRIAHPDAGRDPAD